MKSRFFLFISLGADFLIAVCKFIGAAITGSASMTSEGIHSVIDTVSQVMLIWGDRSSRRLPDRRHPFGYGRELYFWSFMVSLVMFIMGGCISVYEGVNRFGKPFFEGSVEWNYVVLGIAFIFNSLSFISARRAFNEHRVARSFWKAVIRTKDPSTIIVLLGDIADLSGLIIAFLGIYLGRLYHNQYFDGIASVIIGLILIFISGLLIRESRSLLMGESIAVKHIRLIVEMAEADHCIIQIKQHFSIYRSPEDILLQLTAVFKEHLTTRQITDSIENITKNIQAKYPHIKQIFIEPVAK